MLKFFMGNRNLQFIWSLQIKLSRILEQIIFISFSSYLVLHERRNELVVPKIKKYTYYS